MATATTNTNGEFKLTGLLTGPVTLRAEFAGFMKSETETSLIAGNNLWDTGLALGRIAETRPFTIGGTVVNGEGNRVEGATVTLLSAFDSTVRQQVRTDARGNYSFTTYDPGQYVITVMHRDHRAAAETVDFPRDDGSARKINFSLQRRRYCS